MPRRKKSGRRKEVQGPWEGARTRTPSGRNDKAPSDSRETTRPSTVAGGRAALIAWFVALGLLALFFLILKMFAMNAYAGDEHIYLYQGKLVSQGVAPYSGFAMAHPPAQAVFTAILLKIFGYHFALGRMLPVLWCLVGGILLAVIVRRESGGVASIASAALYLLSYEPLRASSHYTGVNMTIAILLAAFLAYRTGYLKTCAVFCVAAVFTRLYAIPGVMALVAWAFLADWRRGLKFVAWGAGIGAAVFLAVGLWAGFGDTAHNMISYHAQKTPMDPEDVANMGWTVLFHNALPAAIFALSLLALVGGVARGWRGTVGTRGILARLKAAAVGARVGLPLLGAFTALFFMAILLNMDRIWMYYFVPAFPFAAIAGGWMISGLLRGALSLARAKGKPGRAGLSRASVVAGGLAVVALGLASYASPALESKLKYWDREMEKPAADRVRAYQWRDGALPGFANSLVRGLLWKEERLIGERHTEFNYLLWHESRVLDVVDDVVAEIEARTDEDDAIFGDSGTVPLFALLSGRRIAANEVDTNSQRYRSGNADPEETARKVDEEGTKLIILRNRFGVAGVPEIRRLVATKYRLVRTFRSAQGRVFLMYERREGQET